MARAVEVFRNNAIELAQSQRGLARQAALLEEQLAHEQNVTQVQRNFLAMITHEFRTPLTQIDGQAQRLISLRDRLRGDDVVERATRMRAAVARIVRLIDNLVDTSRLLDGDANLCSARRRSIWSPCCVMPAAGTGKRRPDAQVREYFAAERLPMRGDSQLLFQVFSNIISNAIKYSPEGADIEIHASQTAESNVCRHQGSRARHSRAGRSADIYALLPWQQRTGFHGTGVGLFLVATVVHLHGGEIAVESSEGLGSQFTVIFPNEFLPSETCDCPKPPHRLGL